MAGSAEGMVTLTCAGQDVADVDSSATITPDTEDFVIVDNSEAGIYEAALGVGPSLDSFTVKRVTTSH
ncbi:hypothetical protein ACFQ0G_45220 [Streptomyces chiangmaiensis]